MDLDNYRLIAEIKVQVLPHGEGLPLPTYATTDSAGMDLRAATLGNLVIEPGQRERIPTGLCMAIPKGTVGYVHSRSGRAYVEGLVLPHGTGVLDSDYRGELLVLVTNIDRHRSITIERGEKIAQLVVVPYVVCSLAIVEALPNSDRGEGGFGSTGQS